MLLLSWLPGWPVAEELRVHPWRAWKLGVVFGRMHATIHTLPAPAILHDHLYAWAGAVMERDLAPKRTPEDLARIHQWAMRWKARAGCPQLEKDAAKTFHP